MILFSQLPLALFSHIWHGIQLGMNRTVSVHPLYYTHDKILRRMILFLILEQIHE